MVEIGRGDAGDQQLDANVAVLRLRLHRAGVIGNIGLGGAIAGIGRHLGEQRARPDIDDRAPARSLHAGHRRIGQPAERDDVEQQHVGHVVAVAFADLAHRGEAGIVDEQRDRLARLQPFLDHVEVVGVGEVGGDHLDIDAVFGRQLFGEVAQPVLAPCDDDEVVAGAREVMREAEADTGRCAGDESDGAGHGSSSKGEGVRRPNARASGSVRRNDRSPHRPSARRPAAS